MGLNANVVRALTDMVATRDPGDERFLAGCLRLLAKWRSLLLANTIIARHGTVVQSGPFAGMDYVAVATEGALAPRLLGVYEHELHPTIEAMSNWGLEEVVDIGCAEGYYAVGLARRLPAVTVNAFDTDARARGACRALAEKNGVADRVRIEGEFRGEDFARFAGRTILVFIDAEGFEDDILRPDLYPALEGFSLVVETHPGFRPGVIERLTERFSPTHDIVRHDPRLQAAVLPDWLSATGHHDMLLAVWEWRATPTPWLVMRPKQPAQSSS